jgi:hypothetical protein
MKSIVMMALSALLQGSLVSRAAETAGRLSIPILFGMIAAMFAIAAIGCLAAALWIFLIPSVGPVWAPVICAGALFALAGILVATGIAISRRMKARAHAPLPSLAAAIPDGLLDDVGDMLKKNQGALLAAALVAGIFAATRRRD